MGLLKLLGAAAIAGAGIYVATRPRVTISPAALKSMTPAQAAEAKAIAASGGNLPCPIAPAQKHCAPQASSEGDKIWVEKQKQKRATEPGPPPPMGSSPARIAAYRERLNALRLQPVAIASIKVAYDRYGQGILGVPTAPVVGFGNGKGFVQTFTGSGNYPAAIFARPNMPAYVVRGGFYDLMKRFSSVGWPIEDEHRVEGPSDIERQAIGIGAARNAGHHSSQRFTKAKMTWNPVTGNATVKVGNLLPWNSIRPKPTPKSAWYEDVWDTTVEHAGTVVAVAEAVTLLPAVAGAVGVGVVLAPFTGGASLLAAGGVVVGAGITVMATKEGVDEGLQAADDM